MADPNPSQQNGGLAYLTPECLDQLCDMIIAKLAVRNPWGLASQARRRGFESHHPLQNASSEELALREKLLTY